MKRQHAQVDVGQGDQLQAEAKRSAVGVSVHIICNKARPGPRSKAGPERLVWRADTGVNTIE